MNASDAIEIGRETIIVAIKLGAPAMLLALVVGLSIAFIQALTQIQEMTLTFVPKILVIMLSLIVLMPFMLNTLVAFTQVLAGHIVSG